MESKITIHTAPNYRPCLKIVEKESEDVRDNLVKQLREQLQHVSITFTVCDMNMSPNGDVSYMLLPVDNELKYFLGQILTLSGFKADSKNGIRIIEFFKDLESVCLGGHKPEAVEKFMLWNKDHHPVHMQQIDSKED